MGEILFRPQSTGTIIGRERENMPDKYKKVEIPGKDITIYAGKQRVADALAAIMKLGVYEGVKVIDLLEIVYDQGKKAPQRLSMASGRWPKRSPTRTLVARRRKRRRDSHLSAGEVFNVQ